MSYHHFYFWTDNVQTIERVDLDQRIYFLDWFTVCLAGEDYLVHKGPRFGGTGGDTVATSASHMSAKWKPDGPTTQVADGTTVSDFVRSGGRDWKLLTDNCHHASRRMVDEHKKK